ncbi:glutamate receptor ionotropic, delta-2-like [Macrobrachium rosenbergii]|uniref:glutamate receptor ionotropic, delta-2-like n=1 Tax=Macrobrachium rosenbergii TaxID=79674 RepID=UPI0034D65164
MCILVIVMETNNPFWWPLTFPPDHWHMKALILIVASHMCSPTQYFQTPLLRRPSSLAVLCPHFTHRPLETVPYKVWTLKPYAKEEKLVHLGMWSQESFRTWEDLFIDRFRDMTMYNMSILVQTSDFPLIYILQGTNVLRGLNIVIMEELQRWLHFDLSYKSRALLPFTENFESVQRGNTDVFINYGTITPERNDLFDITVPFLREGWGIMLSFHPTAQMAKCPLPFLLVGVGSRYRVNVFCYSHLPCSELQETAFNRHQWYYGHAGTHGSLLSRPLDHVPKRWRLRIFLVVWWLVAWWLNLSYTCNLIAVLTVPVLPRKLQTSEELITSDYLLCMVDYGEFLDEALAASTDPVFEALYRKLDMVPSSDGMAYNGEEQCVDRVVAGTHAHTETYSYIVILYNMLGHGSKVYPFKEQLYPAYLGFFVRKHAPWKYKFDQGMEQMLAAGLVEKWYKDSMADFEGYMEKVSAC